MYAATKLRLISFIDEICSSSLLSTIYFILKNTSPGLFIYLSSNHSVSIFLYFLFVCLSLHSPPSRAISIICISLLSYPRRSHLNHSLPICLSMAAPFNNLLSVLIVCLSIAALLPSQKKPQPNHLLSVCISLLFPPPKTNSIVPLTHKLTSPTRNTHKKTQMDHQSLCYYSPHDTITPPPYRLTAVFGRLSWQFPSVLKSGQKWS